MIDHDDLEFLAEEYFGLKLPTERDTLKSRYRQRVRSLHPDLNPGLETSDKFLAMQRAYEMLTTEGVPGVFKDGPQLLKTRDGFPLSELGLGLGPRKNGSTCKECSGKGYQQRFEEVWKPYPPCPMCCICRSTMGCVRCRYKNYTHKQEKFYTICAHCQGTGEIEMFNPVIPKGLLVSGNMTQRERKGHGKA